MGAKIMRVLIDILNIVLLIIGTAGINYAKYCKNSYGYDVCCNTLWFLWVLSFYPIITISKYLIS